MVTARSYELPPLENGDRLTMAEFERRYEDMPDLKKAELIEGVVSLASPVSLNHSEGHTALVGWIATYKALHPQVRAHTDGSVRLDADNQFQPDIFMWKPTGGTARVGQRDLLDGAPELVIEVAASSVSRDLFSKKHVFRRNGVREYIVWRVRDSALDWFELLEGNYVLREPDTAGVIESKQFPGLKLNVPALLSGDLKTVLAGVT